MGGSLGFLGCRHLFKELPVQCLLLFLRMEHELEELKVLAIHLLTPVFETAQLGTENVVHVPVHGSYRQVDNLSLGCSSFQVGVKVSSQLIIIEDLSKEGAPALLQPVSLLLMRLSRHLFQISFGSADGPFEILFIGKSVSFLIFLVLGHILCIPKGHFIEVLIEKVPQVFKTLLKVPLNLIVPSWIK